MISPDIEKSKEWETYPLYLMYENVPCDEDERIYFEGDDIEGNKD